MRYGEDQNLFNERFTEPTFREIFGDKQQVM